MEWYWLLTIVLSILVLLLIALKVYIKLTIGMCRCQTRLDGKTVIVTGANSGIGYEAASDFSRRGARVILACRDSARGIEAAQKIISATGNLDVHFRFLDLASLRSVREFAQNILQSEQHLHILVNNAGAGGLGRVKTEDGFDIILQVNHLAPLLLTNLLLPHMIASAPSRILMVSSIVHHLARVEIEDLNLEGKRDGWFRDLLAYCNSKLFNIIVAIELSSRLRGTNVTVNSLHPGLIYTDAYRNVPILIRIPVLLIIKIFLKSALEGAQTTIYLATSPEVESVSGEYFADCKPGCMSAKARDVELGRIIFELSEKFVNKL